MSNQWGQGLCDCFSDCAICLITWIAPCYTAGKVAEGVGESCVAHCIFALIPFVNIFCQASIRRTIREKKGIEGSFLNDILCHWCCTLCALTQEHHEVQGAQYMARE